MDKRRIIKSYDNLDPEMQKAFEELYPNGYKDYKEIVFRLTNARNENFFVAPMETNDAIYLVKVVLEKPKEEEEDDFKDEDDKEAKISDKEDSYEQDYDLD